MQNLLKKIHDLDISIDIKNNQLDIKAPKGIMTKELLSEIKLHKESLLAFFKEHNLQNSPNQIRKADKKEYYELSSSQYRLWLLHEIEKESSAYNMPSMYSITGSLDVFAFEESVKKLIEKHEILRTNFRVNKKTSKPIQFIHARDENLFRFQFLNFTDKENKESLIENIKREELDYSFNLEDESLIRMNLIKLNEEKYFLIIVLHHIISDAWSSNIILNDLLSNYKELPEKKRDSIFQEIQYKDYAEWQQKQILVNHNSKKYWRNKFEEEIPVLELPTYKLRPQVKTYSGASISKKINQGIVKKFENLCTKNDTTLFIGFQTLLKILLYRYTGESEIVIGCPMSGRELPELQNQIGFYVNTLALHSQLISTDSFIQTLSEVKKITLEAYEHQNYPFDQLIQDLSISTDRSRNPLFDVIFSIDNNLPNKEIIFQDLKIEELLLENKTSKFDLEFLLKKDDDFYDLQVTYSTYLYEPEFIKRVTNQINELLKNIVLEPTKSIKELNFIDNGEREKLLHSFNNTNSEYPKDRAFIELFRQVVNYYPSNIAVEGKEYTLTYKDLDVLSSQLACYLQEELKVKSRDCVGVSLERNKWLIVSFLAVLKIDATYVPIDIQYPDERINFIKKDSNSKLVIDNSLITDFKNFKSKDTESLNINTSSSDNDVAYIIYTSGTTGVPKGVIISQQSLVNLCFWHTKTYSVTEESKSTLYAGISFDASIWEMAPYLLSGSTLFPLDDDIRLNADKLCDFLNYNSISHSYLPTTICHNLISNNKKLIYTKVLTGGDTLKIKKNPQFQLYNNYGPTESTVVTTSYKLTSDKVYKSSVPIGKPISNTRVYILDDNLELLPIGVSGRLYISGAGLANGYLNRPDLTSERFVANPYELGQKMYDTGDTAKWLPDGTIEFLGRKDFQVKLRGYRIELGEIENTILLYSEGITQVVSIVKKESLFVYYTQKTAVDKEGLKSYLEAQLPSYMVPTHYEVLDSIPLTPNGKVDRKVLESLEIHLEASSNYIAPRNKTEEKLVEIWQEVLEIDKIGIRDNFFELGGHSLMVGQVINQIYKQLGGTISYQDFFQNPLIEKVSSLLKKEGYISIPRVEELDYYPLTPSQHRIWVLSQLEGGSQAYNMSGVMTFSGYLDLFIFRQAFQQLINKYEVLRTYFKPNESGDVFQYIQDASSVKFDVGYVDFQDNLREDVDNYLHEEQVLPFDLTEGPLLRLSLLKINEEKHLFSFVMHHIIGDGWSMELLISEVVGIYNNLLNDKDYSSSDLRLQYKDYSVWLQTQLASDSYKESELYWIEKFKGELPLLDLPSFKKRPVIRTHNGTTITHEFSKDFLIGLKDFSRQNGVTLFMTLMSGINTLLYRYTNQEDIIIGTPIAGRDHPDLENQIGLYLNTLAIRTELNADFSFKDLLLQQKQTLLEAYEHQSYPFDELVSKLDLQRDTSRSALFDVMIVLQNQNQLSISSNNHKLESIDVVPYDLKRNTSQVDVSFTFSEETESLSLEIEYNTDIYDSFLLQRIFSHFENLLNEAISNPSKKLLSIDYLTNEERTQVLEVFNDTKVDYPKDNTIVDLFEEQVRRTPDNIAIVFEDTELTYKALNEKSNQLGAYLQKNYNIQPDDLVGLKLDRSENLLVVILGILKSGAAYVPIDTNYPEDRIAYIENDSNAKLVIDGTLLEDFERSRSNFSKDNITSRFTTNDLAYVIYTSGTTGKPKGVMVTQKNIVNQITWYVRNFELDAITKSILLTSHTFDPSTQDMFGTLITGGKLYLLSTDKINDLEYLYEFIDENKISILNYVPNFIGELLCDRPKINSLKTIIVGGEALIPQVKDKLLSKGYRLFNNYGPTETTVDVLSGLMKEGTVHIGKPIANTKVYVLGANNTLLPIGVKGRLMISGEGVSKGYLNRSKLTEEKFIDNPFNEREKMYETGDVARWLPDGTIDFLGRNDDQVKIRGYRIELGEIENTILSYSEYLNQVIVLVKEEVLVVYYTEKENLDKEALKRYIEEQLPSYMVPNYFKVLKSIPLTSNGKVDRRALPDINESDLLRKEYITPETEIEKELVKIWEEILDIKKIGVTDNFFDLGGNSMLAIKAYNKMKLIFDDIRLTDLYSKNTIRSIASMKDEKSLNVISEIEF